LVDLGVSSVEILKICDKVEEEQPKVFGSHIELNLENSSDLGVPPVEAAGESPGVVEISDEPSVEGKAVEEVRTGESPVHGMEAGDSCFEDYPGDDFEKVGKSYLRKPHNHPLTLFLPFPRKKPHPALNRGERGLRPWLGERIYPGSES